MRRNQLEIMSDILRVALDGGSVTKTDIVYKGNLNFNRVKLYLELLIKMGLIGVKMDVGGRKLYFTTEKGEDFLTDYEKVEKS